MKIRITIQQFRTLAFAIALFPVCVCSTAKAQTIQWAVIPQTNQPSVMEPNPTPASIGINTVTRRNHSITFDAIIENQYVRYNGNCRTMMLYRIKIGEIDDNNQPINIRPYPNEKWFRANEYQQRILNAVCSRKTTI
jgi:hypothetical protein